MIGASTGGPGHLKKILSIIPSSYQGAIIIAQHMNSTFIPSFISQFQTELSIPVHSIDTKTSLENGHIYICSQHCELKKEYHSLIVQTTQQGQTPYNPSIDTLFCSAVECLKNAEILAILLTGIGHDGAQGLSELQKHGAQCIAENEETAIVYGMPKRAIEINPDIPALPLGEIIRVIQRFGES